MSHVFQLSDEQYSQLTAYATQQKQTPEMLFQAWLNEVMRNVKDPMSSKRAERVSQERQEGREGETLNSPLFQLIGSLDIDVPDLADKHDEYLAEAYMENHAKNY